MRKKDEDTRRRGDDRPAEDDPDVHLTFLPAHKQPFRWLPKHGQPLCIGEWFTQHFIKTLAYWPVYNAVVITAMFVTWLIVRFWL